eukprot:scaffold21232_cov57-Skeletonema_dohrnii-CCMP3373.AAC.2
MIEAASSRETKKKEEERTRASPFPWRAGKEKRGCMYVSIRNSYFSIAVNTSAYVLYVTAHNQNNRVGGAAANPKNCSQNT